jgi:hypothetical protein
MSTLTDRTGRVPAPQRRPAPTYRGFGPSSGRAQLAAGALAAVQAALASLVVILVPVVLAWATASYSRAPWGEAVQVGVAAWLLAHHCGIVIPGGHVGLAPLGLTLIPLVSCWLAGVRLARNLDPNAEAIRSGIGRRRPARPAPRALMALVLTYAGLVTLASALTTTAGVRPLVPQAFIGATAICTIGAATGVAAWVSGGFWPGVRRVIAGLRLPVPVTRCLRPIGLAVAVQLAGAAAVLVTAFVLGWDRVLLLHHALSPGAAGGLVLTVGQLTVLPNLLVWCAAWTSGPGFAVGTGTSVMPGHTDLGALPAIPVLGALPTPGEGPQLAWLALALPVLAGAVAGWYLLRAAPDVLAGPASGRDGVRTGRAASSDGTVRSLLIETGLTAVLTGVFWLVLGWMSAGPAGPGRLAQMGPSSWQLGLAAGVEVGIGAALVVGGGLLVRYLSPNTLSTQVDSPDSRYL